MNKKNKRAATIRFSGASPETAIDLPVASVERALLEQWSAMAQSDDEVLRAQGRQRLAEVAAFSAKARLHAEHAAAIGRAGSGKTKHADHDRIMREFNRLLRCNMTPAQARGALVQRGLVSQATIYRWTRGTKDK